MNTVENVLKVLGENKVVYKKSEHEPVRTSEEASKIRGVPLKSGVKALLLKTREGNFIMVLVPADKKVDMKKVAELEGTKKVQLASPKEVLEETGCEIGGVPPFGHTEQGEPNRIKTYMDKDVLENDIVNFNAGDRSVSVTMKSEDLIKVIDYIKF